MTLGTQRILYPKSLENARTLGSNICKHNWKKKKRACSIGCSGVPCSVCVFETGSHKAQNSLELVYVAQEALELVFFLPYSGIIGMHRHTTLGCKILKNSVRKSLPHWSTVGSET